MEIEEFSQSLNESQKVFNEYKRNDKEILLNENQYQSLELLQYQIDSVQSPVQKIEHNLHGFVSYVVIPIFALATLEL